MQNTKETNDALDANKTTVREKKRLKLYIGLGAIFSALILAYLLIGFHYQKVFFPATTVNGVDVSGLTPARARELLNANAAEYILNIIEDGEKSEQISGSCIGLYVKDDATLQDIVENQNIITWAFQAFQQKAYALDIGYDEEKLLSTAKALSCMDNKTWNAPENAYITYQKGIGYQIVPEKAGNELIPESFLESVKAAVNHMEVSLSLRDAGVYKQPEILADNAALTEQFASLQKYSDMTVTYQFDDQTEVLDGDTLSEWVSLDKNGDLTIDEEAAAEFIKGLARKYNTAYTPKTLKTSYGETITIREGFYGWQIDRAAELESLLDVIRDGKSVTREPVYLMRAASHGETDYGNTYVEINLTAQHLFYYKNGELLVESDFVSGNPSRGNATPAGAFAVTYTERNATLRGQDYSTPVSYWMPFNGNIGMHDSSWRSSFGGAIYRTNGSHGCINLPAAAAKTIFENIEKGIPVLCYHLEGTRPDTGISTSEQITAEITSDEQEEQTIPETNSDEQEEQTIPGTNSDGQEEPIIPGINSDGQEEQTIPETNPDEAGGQAADNTPFGEQTLSQE